MRVIAWEIDTGFAGGIHEGEFEVDDDATDAEIDEMVQQELWNLIEYSWREVKDDTSA